MNTAQTTRNKLLKLITQQLELLLELAATYYHADRAVPVEVGNALGAAAHRQRQLVQLNRMLGVHGDLPQNKKVIKQYLDDINHYSETIKACVALTANSTSSATPDD